MTIPITPPIGMRGIFILAAPFDVKVDAGIEYTCQAIRRISDYLAENEDPKALVYTANGIEDQYEQDAKENSYIVSLQSRKGHGLRVPVKYILSFPSGSGVPYRSIAIVTSLPSLPLDQSLEEIESEIKSLVEGRLGVTVAMRQVETSQTVLVDDDIHTQKTVERGQRKTHQSLYQENVALKRQVTELLERQASLEQYILDHQP